MSSFTFQLRVRKYQMNLKIFIKLIFDSAPFWGTVEDEFDRVSNER